MQKAKLNILNIIRDSNKSIMDCTYLESKHRLIFYINNNKEEVTVFDQRIDGEKIPDHLIDDEWKKERFERLYI